VSRTPRARATLSAFAVAALAFVGVGLLGAFRDVQGFWLYRGFPPPTYPSWVTRRGTVQKVSVLGPSVGGKRQTVWVYLPPGYRQNSSKRYPVLYLLHGYPELPIAYLRVGRVQIEEDVLLSEHRMKPTIIVMPYGTSGYFTDEQWANGVRPGSDWESFVASDLVDAIDQRYRTIPTGPGRAIGGLSSGGYGAFNIALHHAGEFGMVESWSGYVLAEDLHSIFDESPSLLAYNSPLLYLRDVAPALRAAHTYFWFYVGRNDGLRTENERFAAALTQWRIAHRFFLGAGRHNWGLWRVYVPQALIIASRHLAHG
jgi:enterochelin esterase-like enzyme